MHMSMPACAHAQVCPCSPTATAISSSHLITKLPFQREVNSRLPKSHSSSRDTDLLSSPSLELQATCAHDVGMIPPTSPPPPGPWDDSTLWVPGLETFLNVSNSFSLPPAWHARLPHWWLPHTLPSPAFLSFRDHPVSSKGILYCSSSPGP